MKKQIKLKPAIVFHNYAKIIVMDFPKGDGPGGTERERCRITVEFAESDIERILSEHGGFEGCVTYYEEWLYNVVKVNLGTDWECVDGYEQVMKIIEEHIGAYVNK